MATYKEKHDEYTKNKERLDAYYAHMLKAQIPEEVLGYLMFKKVQPDLPMYEGVYESKERKSYVKVASDFEYLWYVISIGKAKWQGSYLMSTLWFPHESNLKFRELLRKATIGKE